jgi:hypothetical protein
MKTDTNQSGVLSTQHSQISNMSSAGTTHLAVGDSGDDTRKLSLKV